MIKDMLLAFDGTADPVVRDDELHVDPSYELELRRRNIRTARALISWIRVTPSAFMKISGQAWRPYLAKLLWTLRRNIPHNALVKRKYPKVAFGAMKPIGYGMM